MTNDCSGSSNPDIFSVDLLPLQLESIYDNSSNRLVLNYLQDISSSFVDFDAIAIIDVPKNKLDDLFMIHVDYNDVFDNSTNAFSFAIGPWTNDISFSEALVTDETAIESAMNTQTIQADMMRYVLSSMTQSLNIHALFSNKASMRQEIQQLDASFNANIRNILSQIGGTPSEPMTNSMTQNNPARNFVHSILDTSNSNTTAARKLGFLDFLQQNKERFMNGDFVSLPLDYYEKIAIQITYYPPYTTFFHQPIKPRTYKILLNMAMEMEHQVVFDEAFLLHGIGTYYVDSVDNSSARLGSILYDADMSMNTFQSSGYNDHDFWIFWNDINEKPGVSPYNFYPMLSDISDIVFQTNPQEDNMSRNWNISLYTRKTNIEKYEFYQTKYTSILTYSNGWNNHTIRNIDWQDELGNIQSIQKEEPLLGIQISLGENGYDGFRGQMTPIWIYFNDSRIVRSIY